MRKLLQVLTVSVVLTSALFSQEKPAQNNSGVAKPPADVRFSVDLLDKSIDPCNDFLRLRVQQVEGAEPGSGRPPELGALR